MLIEDNGCSAGHDQQPFFLKGQWKMITTAPLQRRQELLLLHTPGRSWMK